jgi:hypothetical protein
MHSSNQNVEDIQTKIKENTRNGNTEQIATLIKNNIDFFSQRALFMILSLV